MFSSNASQVSSDAVFIEDTFSTTLYTGNGSTQTINNGIDLAGKGGLVWLKQRSLALNHLLMDSARGVTNYLSSNTTSAQTSGAPVTFSSTGLSIASGGAFWNQSSDTYASWTFRKQQKFFDCVTWTGNGTTGRQISHALGSTPGCVIVKKTSAAQDWHVYHRGLTTPTNKVLVLNSTGAEIDFGSAFWGVSDTTFTLAASGGGGLNNNGDTYVAYLFAHNAGGFGLTGTDNVISCGSYTGNGSTSGPTVNLGYEPQWLLVKRAVGGTEFWQLIDNMRSFTADGTVSVLYPNATNAENAGLTSICAATATGFEIKTTSAAYNASGNTYIYIAIRRGPMKTPTAGTSVYNTILQTPQSAGTLRTVGFPADLMIGTYTAAATPRLVNTRLTGFANTSGASQNTPGLQTQSTNAESNQYPLFFNVWNTTARDGDYIFGSNGVNWMFGRAPGFMDVCCYTGTGSARTVAHNLGVVPELMIVKNRSGTTAWSVYDQFNGPTMLLQLNASALSQASAVPWNNTAPTASVFTVGTGTPAFTNASGSNYVAYLFASCPGVSKVGSYTGTGTTQQINCGFTGGARFVLIKRTDSTGDWYVWDSARGIVAGNDPYLLLNSTAAEVTNTDYVDTYSAGFEISSTAPAAINASGGTFIYLAIA